MVLTLVGESGAGAHDLVRMMRNGRIYWTAPESQFYAEPKKLAQAGYLSADHAAGQDPRPHALHADRRRPGGAEGVAGDADAASRASRTSRSSACWGASTPIGGNCWRA